MIHPDATSATRLRDHLRRCNEQFATSGRRLNEGAARVLGKLETVSASGLRRTYRKEGRRVTLWDVMSDVELLERGYAETRRNSYTIWAEETVKRDRITCWMSEKDSAEELWVGEALRE